VQALYQMELAGEGVETVISEFSNHRFDADIEGEPLAEADEDYFAEIVRGVVGGQRDIDAAVKARLASNWRMERLDSTLRALLRAGAGNCASVSPTCRARSSSTSMSNWPRPSSTTPRPNSSMRRSTASPETCGPQGLTRSCPPSTSPASSRPSASLFAPLAHPRMGPGPGGRRRRGAVAPGLRSGPDQGRHRRGRAFPPDDPLDTVARKLMRVNLSDLAAKGAEPFGYLLACHWSERCGWPERETFCRRAGGSIRRRSAWPCWAETRFDAGTASFSMTMLGWIPKGRQGGGARGPGRATSSSSPAGSATAGWA
jgi:hypothetical protein